MPGQDRKQYSDSKAAGASLELAGGFYSLAPSPPYHPAGGKEREGGELGGAGAEGGEAAQGLQYQQTPLLVCPREKWKAQVPR